jgi:hypothetical protein
VYVGASRIGPEGPLTVGGATAVATAGTASAAAATSPRMPAPHGRCRAFAASRPPSGRRASFYNISLTVSRSETNSAFVAARRSRPKSSCSMPVTRSQVPGAAVRTGTDAHTPSANP